MSLADSSVGEACTPEVQFIGKMKLMLYKAHKKRENFSKTVFFLGSGKQNNIISVSKRT